MLDLTKPLEFVLLPPIEPLSMTFRRPPEICPARLIEVRAAQPFLTFMLDQHGLTKSIFNTDLCGNGEYAGRPAFVRNCRPPDPLHECYGPDLRCGSLGSGELRLIVPAKAAFPGAEWKVDERVFKVAHCPFCGLKAT